MFENLNYDQALEKLFSQVTAFHKVGNDAYKPGLDRTIHLVEAFGNPHKQFATIHVGGTNGKGSVSSTLAAILRLAGYRVGLYTSPHLIDFRERIRVDGEMISQDEVLDFLNRYDLKNRDNVNDPSFFELTTAMAFDHFARKGVDIAVIEVGLGGRLDSTNIIKPILSVITNISLDHTALLGNSTEAIAVEKAGIIKPGVPVVIGEAEGEVKNIFARRAAECGSVIVFADSIGFLLDVDDDGEYLSYRLANGTLIRSALRGACQPRNAATILAAVDCLRAAGIVLPDEAVCRGFTEVCTLSGIIGRWQRVSVDPIVICDTGHNVGGWIYTVRNLMAISGKKILVLGFVNDKDVLSIIELLRDVANIEIVVTRPSVERALPPEQLVAIIDVAGLSGNIVGVFDSVTQATEYAVERAKRQSGMVLVGGSTFVVADYLRPKEQ